MNMIESGGAHHAFTAAYSDFWVWRLAGMSIWVCVWQMVCGSGNLLVYNSEVSKEENCITLHISLLARLCQCAKQIVMLS